MSDIAAEWTNKGLLLATSISWWLRRNRSRAQVRSFSGYKNGFYAWKQLLLSAHLSHHNSVHLSVCLSVTRVNQWKTVQARITKSLLSAAWKTLVSGTVKLFHKFEGGHPKRGR